MTETVLITGSTSGIGDAFTRKFAKEGYHLILVARNEEKLRNQSAMLTGKYGIHAHAIAWDLEAPDAAEQIFQKIQDAGLSVHILVNNAGFNEYGSFLDTDLKKELGMIQLHMVFTTKMMKFFLPSMSENRHGHILNIGSTGSYIPCPYDAVYAATKAYLLSLSKGIGAEFNHSGVTVTTICPGATRTAFASKAGMEHTLLFQLFVMEPEKVADIGYRAMLKGKRKVIAGLYNKLVVLSSYILPEKLVNYIGKKMLIK